MRPNPVSSQDLARHIFHAALAHCRIDQAFSRRVHLHGTELTLGNLPRLDLSPVNRIRIIAAGKAAAPMLQSLLARLPAESIAVDGILAASTPPPNLPAGIRFFPAGHPIPNDASFAAARAALRLAAECAAQHPGTPGTLCIVLLSGGASAMLELPLDPTLTLADTAALYHSLVRSGASITEVNCVRKHFSAIKAGRLALAIGQTPLLTILVSDVPAAHPDALASGPTVADTSTLAQCREIIARFNLAAAWPPAVQRFFASPHLPETPRQPNLPGLVFPLLAPEDLANAAADVARAHGLHPVIDTGSADQPYAKAAAHLLRRARMLRPGHPRLALISVGEVALRVPEASTGIGGRNSHFALHAATLLHPGDGDLAILSAGSDGIDGSSAAAGAVVHPSLLGSPPGRKAEALHALASFNSAPFLQSCSASVITGPTGNNLRDLRLVVAQDLLLSGIVPVA